MFSVRSTAVRATLASVHFEDHFGCALAREWHLAVVTEVEVGLAPALHLHARAPRGLCHRLVLPPHPHLNGRGRCFLSAMYRCTQGLALSAHSRSLFFTCSHSLAISLCIPRHPALHLHTCASCRRCHRLVLPPPRHLNGDTSVARYLSPSHCLFFRQASHMKTARWRHHSRLLLRLCHRLVLPPHHQRESPSLTTFWSKST